MEELLLLIEQYGIESQRYGRLMDNSNGIMIWEQVRIVKERDKLFEKIKSKLEDLKTDEH